MEKNLSAGEFSRLIDQLKAGKEFSDDSIEIVRQVLVEGQSMSEAARQWGMSRQAVSQLLKRVRRRMEDVPAAWVKFDEWLPPEVAEALANLVLAASEKKTFQLKVLVSKEGAVSVLYK